LGADEAQKSVAASDLRRSTELCDNYQSNTIRIYNDWLGMTPNNAIVYKILSLLQ